jgi:Protein of unknown function (DUF4240)
MEYKNFEEDLYRLMGKYGGISSLSNDETLDLLEKCRAEALESWFQKGLYAPLVRYIVDEYDTGGGDELIIPLSNELAKKGDLEKLKSLWRPTIATRSGRYWDFHTSKDQVKIHTLRAMKQWISALSELGAEKESSKIAEDMALVEADKRPNTPPDLRIIGETIVVLDLIESSGKSCQELMKAHATRMNLYWDGLARMDEIKEQTRDAMKRYSSTLLELGAKDEANKIAEDLALFEAGKRPKKKKPSDMREIDETVFWDLIESSKGPTCPEVVEALCCSLECFPPKQLRNFQRIFDQKMDRAYSWELWAVAYIIRHGCSDDAFDYFRAWLISCGRKAFEVALDNPASVGGLAEPGSDAQCESLMGAAQTAHFYSTGKAMRLRERKAPIIRGQEWSEDDLLSRYPELCKKFDYK